MKKSRATPARRGKGASEKEGILSPQAIIDLMLTEGRPLYLREIAGLVGPEPSRKRLVKGIVDGLVRDGSLVLLKGDRYGLSSLMHLVTGTLTIHPDGFGFVKPATGEEPDIFIPPKGLKGAAHRDRVVVRIEEKKGRRLEGSILRVLERGNRLVVGTFRRGRNVSLVVPEDERLIFEVIVPRKATLRARDGDVVVCEILEHPKDGRDPEGRVSEILGDPEDMDVQAKIVAFRHDLPSAFPEEALEEAGRFPPFVSGAEMAGREDLRDLPLVTIDGENARDFDDAVHVKKTRGGFVLTVAIADVSHYVREGTALDGSARERGTSVYFPNSVIPMLPEALSNHLCSLVPNQDRLATAAIITFDRSGSVRRTSFCTAIIRSSRRFTYSEVSRILSGDVGPLGRGEERFVERLKAMEELARILMGRRKERGSVDFDLPEPYLVLGLTGRIEDIVRRERNIAHQLIEEFMIAANEAVAGYLSRREIPALYRIHGEPDRQRVNDFVSFARTLGLDIAIPDDVTPGWCQGVLAMASGVGLDYVINTMLLRSMQQAVYSPENKGHFGLASETYLHFTSPIRRYPDLVVHRILKANLRRARKTPVYTDEALGFMGEHCSKRERSAMEAEREMIERLKVRFMEERIGETFEGVISGVASFGFFVELADIFVEGAVRLVDLADDYYIFDQTRHRLFGKNTRRVFQIGDRVTVVLKGVNVRRRHINFEIAEKPAP